MSDIAFLPAKRLAGLIRRRKVGCLELLDHYLARVERFNPALNAIIVTDIPNARRRARAADRALAKGESWGPLHGVPMTVKESFDVAGLPTTWGVPALKNHVAARNALAVDRWLGAGAVIFGKTNVPIWLADAQSYNAIYGTTVSPWDPKLVPGGSSGGATASLAAGMTGIEMGSDIASSIRTPAALCGVWGHKPTMGICPTDGHTVYDNVAPLDILVIGPLARSADDLALGLSILAGPDAIDGAGLRLALPAPRQTRLRDFRVGVVTGHPTAPVDREVSALIGRLADFLSKQKAKVSDTARPDIDLHEAHRTFDVLLRGATSARFTDAEQQTFCDELASLPPGTDTKRSRMLRGNTLLHRDWLRLNEARHRMRRKWHDWFQDYDLLLCPVLCTAALPHDQRPPYERNITVNGKEYPATNQLFWSGYSCMSYLPATAAPIGFTKDGRPVGVQIVGPQYGDRTCIAFARLLEKEYQGFVAPPGFE
ncbi:MAG: amidase [Rhodospirillales bacterium]